MYYKVGAIYLSLKQPAKAREYARKAIGLNSKFGDPYILIAQCYVSSPNWHNDKVLNGCVYYAAIDKLNRAKAVDPTVKDQANKLISQYSNYTPSTDELFMRGYSKGKSITIGGWINETTTIR
jgi:tetratricopeptide (TPR) repeat protein